MSINELDDKNLLEQTAKIHLKHLGMCNSLFNPHSTPRCPEAFRLIEQKWHKLGVFFFVTRFNHWRREGQRWERERGKRTGRDTFSCWDTERSTNALNSFEFSFRWRIDAYGRKGRSRRKSNCLDPRKQGQRRKMFQGLVLDEASSERLWLDIKALY
jgi:hypothetical protein